MDNMHSHLVGIACVEHLKDITIRKEGTKIICINQQQFTHNLVTALEPAFIRIIDTMQYKSIRRSLVGVENKTSSWI